MSELQYLLMQNEKQLPSVLTTSYVFQETDDLGSFARYVSTLSSFPPIRSRLAVCRE